MERMKGVFGKTGLEILNYMKTGCRGGSLGHNEVRWERGREVGVVRCSNGVSED